MRNRSLVPRKPLPLTSRMSIAASRERSPSMISASRSSSARNERSRPFRTDLPAGTLQTRKEIGISLAQRNCRLFDLTLAIGDVVVDGLGVLQIVRNRAVGLRQLEDRIRLNDLFRRRALLKANDNGIERNTGADDIETAIEIGRASCRERV